MKRETVKVASVAERAVLEPHIERYRAFLATVRMLNPDNSLSFDVDTLSWYREVAE